MMSERSVTFGDPLAVRSSRGDYGVQEVPRARLYEGLDVVVTDAHVAAAIGAIPVPHLILPPGEATKSLSRYGEVLAWMAQQGLHRRSVVGALGGGVIGDLVGFAAATYMRGIRYVQIPTTLLAMVDSSVGGKVAVDLPEGKNLVGAFHPPIEVRLDLSTLATLPARQLNAGMAEVVKTFAIGSGEEFLGLNQRECSPDRRDLPHLVRWCIEYKRRIVEEDEDETNGLRATLNFGHTIGHAIESVTGYERFLHGEAIAIGMVLETRLGERLGITVPGTETCVASTLKKHRLPTALPPDLDPADLLVAMRRDKKARQGRLAFALLEDLGSARLVEDVPESAVREVLRG